eukprot:CAMPEP_0176139774 /NCGR_PEP_ID=MMETSP0120_2-20121206/71030_1 /TAXON_ID=160619 /ORGANISM="Kryptoperidinium foliaceum, Strain CCMP 1326" /LENGTH=300 /DNA_ID=CAMNT_0017475793 /DNA_START=396 /DNA_END=1297 /DNA_ORIENTATION=+
MSASRKKACSRLAQDTAMVVKLCLVHRQAEIQRSHHRMLQAVQLLQTQAAYLGIRIVAQNVIIVPLRSEHQAGRGESVACLWTYGQCRVPLEHAIDVDKCDHIALVAATEVPAQPIHVALDGNIWNPSCMERRRFDAVSFAELTICAKTTANPLATVRSQNDEVGRHAFAAPGTSTNTQAASPGFIAVHASEPHSAGAARKTAAFGGASTWRFLDDGSSVEPQGVTAASCARLAAAESRPSIEPRVGRSRPADGVRRAKSGTAAVPRRPRQNLAHELAPLSAAAEILAPALCGNAVNMEI